MKVTAPGTPAARSLREVCEAARQANCGHCWAGPGDECVFTSVPMSVPVTPGTPVKPARGYHVARFARAMHSRDRAGRFSCRSMNRTSPHANWYSGRSSDTTSFTAVTFRRSPRIVSRTSLDSGSPRQSTFTGGSRRTDTRKAASSSGGS